ncbi:MAG: PBP1A family penicillin-binding protein [Oligoflexia bacterium]|nr:PBP1A family penicillin-binding protein [Oligoflexia bacterium]
MARLFTWLVVLISSSIIALSMWVKHLDNTIKSRLSQKRWSAPTEYYSAPERILKGQKKIVEVLNQTLERLEYKKIQIEKKLIPGEFSLLNYEKCKPLVTNLSLDITSCYVWVTHPRVDQTSEALNNNQSIIQVVALTQDTVIEVYEGLEFPLQAATVIELEPELFAQFYGGQPVLRKIVNISEVPTYLLNAIMAIEDSQFLNHGGVSWSGILRALFKNVIHGGVKEGGSTITQQLVKNYFLTHERTIKRKVTEIFMALLLETRFSKDEILDTYINEIYLGQAGPFEIHGVGVASKFFFNKHPGDLTLSEAAWLAGSIRGPGVYSPFSHADRALKRRTQVLERMLELNLIDQQEYQAAMNEPLAQKPQRLLRDQAPFFIESVKHQLRQLNLNDHEGLRVYTTLNLRAQQAATEAMSTQLKEKLQGALISADPTNGFVEAVVGGRSFSETQLNRAVNSKRQVGSIFKPFVFLAAFESLSFNPLTEVEDAPYTFEYEGQSWTPNNYDDKYFGKIPLFMALEKSLNSATTQVAMQVGIKKVADVASRLGINSDLLAVPSLALGSATLSPFEVLQAYTTLSRQGEFNQLTFIYKIMNTSNNVLYQHRLEPIQAVDKVTARQVISLMEGAVDRGTGRSIRLSGFTHPAAGKTGTTSDTKDTWFGGFTPLHVAVVWAGYDTPEPTGLTGASGALPIWIKYMKDYAANLPAVEFSIPEGAVELSFKLGCSQEFTQNISLVFREDRIPSSPCWERK